VDVGPTVQFSLDCFADSVEGFAVVELFNGFLVVGYKIRCVGMKV